MDEDLLRKKLANAIKKGKAIESERDALKCALDELKASDAASGHTECQRLRRQLESANSKLTVAEKISSASQEAHSILQSKYDESSRALDDAHREARAAREAEKLVLLRLEKVQEDLDRTKQKKNTTSGELEDHHEVQTTNGNGNGNHPEGGETISPSLPSGFLSWSDLDVRARELAERETALAGQSAALETERQEVQAAATQMQADEAQRKVKFAAAQVSFQQRELQLKEELEATREEVTTLERRNLKVQAEATEASEALERMQLTVAQTVHEAKSRQTRIVALEQELQEVKNELLTAHAQRDEAEEASKAAQAATAAQVAQVTMAERTAAQQVERECALLKSERDDWTRQREQMLSEMIKLQEEVAAAKAAAAATTITTTTTTAAAAPAKMILAREDEAQLTTELELTRSKAAGLERQVKELRWQVAMLSGNTEGGSRSDSAGGGISAGGGLLPVTTSSTYKRTGAGGGFQLPGGIRIEGDGIKLPRHMVNKLPPWALGILPYLRLPFFLIAYILLLHLVIMVQSHRHCSSNLPTGPPGLDPRPKF